MALIGCFTMPNGCLLVALLDAFTLVVQQAEFVLRIASSCSAACGTTLPPGVFFRQPLALVVKLSGVSIVLQHHLVRRPCDTRMQLARSPLERLGRRHTGYLIDVVPGHHPVRRLCDTTPMLACSSVECLGRCGTRTQEHLAPCQVLGRQPCETKLQPARSPVPHRSRIGRARRS